MEKEKTYKTCETIIAILMVIIIGLVLVGFKIESKYSIENLELKQTIRSLEAENRILELNKKNNHKIQSTGQTSATSLVDID